MASTFDASAFARLRAGGFAYAAWKPGAYPTDSYPRLAQAMAIDLSLAFVNYVS